MYDGGVGGFPKAHLTALLKSKDSDSDLSDLTIGVWDEWLEDATPAVVADNKRVLNELVKKGAKVRREYDNYGRNLSTLVALG